jgi:hypothetical protein
MEVFKEKYKERWKEKCFRGRFKIINVKDIIFEKGR